MIRIIVFFTVFISCVKLLSYPVCLNEEKIAENCIKDVYKNGDIKLVLDNIDDVVFKNNEHKSAVIIDALYRSGRYDDVEKAINALPQKLKNSLYYKVLSAKSMFARKRFNQTAEMLDSIKEGFPVYYLSSRLECIKGDMALYRKQFDSALEFYDKCGLEKNALFSSYNRILALEKKGVPQNTLFEDYIEFAEKFEGSILVPKIMERFVYLKEKNNYPSLSSPYFTRWLAIMRKTSMLDRFFNDDFLKLQYPAALEVIKYLVAKGRYSDALSVVEKELLNSEKDLDRKFDLVNEKQKLMTLLNQSEKASEFMLNSASGFPKAKKDKLEFFAGLNYFDSGYVEEGRAVLENIVINNQESKYFLTALYKLGLIYLGEGNQLYTFTLWSNFIFDPSFSPAKYHGGARLLSDMTELAALIDRLNNFCLLSSDIDFDCNVDETCIPDPVNQVVSYYDFVYYSLINRTEFKTKLDHSNKEYIEKWQKNRIELNVDEAPVIEKMASLPKKTRSSEYVAMVEFFLNAGVKDGVLFYLDVINKLLQYDGTSSSIVKIPDNESLIAVNADLADFKTRTGDIFIRFLGKTGDIADSNYKAVYQNLSYSPHYGKKEEWKLIYPTPYFDDIMKLSVEFDVPPQLIYSIMRAETFYRDNLVSKVGALGLMQVMPYTFEKISKYGGIKIKDPFNPYESMKASAWYLSKLLKRFDGSYVAAIAAYNAGPHKVTNWIDKYKGMETHLFVEMIPYQETRNYVKKVLRYFLIYSYLYENTFYDVGLNGALNIEEQPDIVNF